MLIWCSIFAAAVFVFLMHEVGHFVTALFFGLHPSVSLGWDKVGDIPLPSILIHFKTAKEDWKNRLVAVMGFGASAIAGVVFLALPGTPGTWVNKHFLLSYWTVFAAHFLIYPFKKRGSPSSDFRHLV